MHTYPGQLGGAKGSGSDNFSKEKKILWTFVNKTKLLGAWKLAPDGHKAFINYVPCPPSP